MSNTQEAKGRRQMRKLPNTRRPESKDPAAIVKRLKKELQDKEWIIEKTNAGLKALYGELAKVNASLEQKVRERTEELAQSNEALEDQLAERKRSEKELRKTRDHLDQLVIERTSQLEATNRELEAFAYSVSHDLRAPLRSIDGFSLALFECCADKLDSEGKSYLQRVRVAAGRMGELIDDMLTLSRITRSEMHRAHVDLSALAKGVADELKAAEPDREVQITVQSGLAADCDAHLLRVVMNNLLGNAWKFTGKTENPKIKFGARNSECPSCSTPRPASRSPRSDGVAYFVRDNGAGFDMTYAEKLFGAFQRLHSTEEFPGTGIGLATVQRVINRHGGRVWAEGEVGKGATFYFTLGARSGLQIPGRGLTHGAIEGI